MKRTIRYMCALLLPGMLSALLLGLLVPGCGNKDQDEARHALPPPMNAPEAERGTEACAAYVERVCACAQTKPEDAELAEQCHMAPAKSKSLDMVLEVNGTTESADERVKTERTARRIMASCIEEQSKLDSRGCPRSPPGSPPHSPPGSP
jgi:hypothetical protein